MGKIENASTLLLTTLFLFSPINVKAAGFLSKSKILSEANVTIVPAQVLSNDKIFPVIGSAQNAKPKFLLADNGQIYQLDMVKEAKKEKLNIHTCGEDQMASPWRLSSKQGKKITGQFIATGKDFKNIRIKWTPAKYEADPKTPACFFYKKDYKSTDVSIAQLEGIKNKIVFSNFDSPESIKFRELLKKISDKAYQEKKECDTPDNQFQRIGELDGNSCKTILEAPVNCDGQGYHSGQLDKPIGVVEISNSNKTERWMIFSASGYEGDAYLGILQTDTYPAKEENIDFYVYSGC